MSRRAGTCGRVLWVAFVGAVSLLALLLVWLVVSLRGVEDDVEVRFDSPERFAVQENEARQSHLTLAVAPVINPRDSFPAWRDLSDYIGRRLSLTVDLVQRRTYVEVDQLLERQEVELALVCSGPYVSLRQRGIVHMLVVPRVGGEVVYRSCIVVNADSNVQSIADLRGKRFAFSDPSSNSGALYPTYLLHEMGEKPATYFSRLVHTYGHDRSVLSVASGIVDGAAVDSIVFESLLSRRPDLRDRLRVIDRSPPFGINPVVVRSNLPPALKRDLEAAFVGMAADQEGRAVLGSLGIDRFEPGDPELYESIEKMKRAIGE